MRIVQNHTKNNIAFNSSQLNILAMADNHGCIETMPKLIKTVDNNKSDIFQKSDEKSTLNVFAIAGDYFYSPDNNGLLTEKESTLGDIEYDFLTKTIDRVKSNLDKSANFETVFTLGNHELEGGASLILNKLKDAPMTSIFTNTKLRQSPLLKKLMATHDNLVVSKIYEIPDDKNPEIINHALFLGVTIPRKKFNGKKLTGMSFYDRLDKSDNAIVREDFEKTYKVLDHKVKTFKEKHPNGAVILLSHVGNNVSGHIAQEIPQIDLILNAHDHKKSDMSVNNTLISSLGENNKFVKGFDIKFDDYGKLSQVNVKKFETKTHEKSALEDADLQNFVKQKIGNDIRPLVDLSPHSELIEELKYTKDVRYSSKLFVNYVTSGIKEALQISYPDVDLVAMPAESFRGGLASIDGDKAYFNNLDLIKMFGGINKDNSRIKIGELTGKELRSIILQNVIKNIDNPKNNGILHWSDIKVDRTLLIQIKNNETDKSLKEVVKFRNPQTNKYERLEPNKIYKVAMSDKYILKELNKTKDRNLFENRFHTIRENFPTLLREYLDLIDYRLEFSDEIKEPRIV